MQLFWKGDAHMAKPGAFFSSKGLRCFLPVPLIVIASQDHGELIIGYYKSRKWRRKRSTFKKRGGILICSTRRRHLCLAMGYERNQNRCVCGSYVNCSGLTKYRGYISIVNHTASIDRKLVSHRPQTFCRCGPGWPRTKRSGTATPIDVVRKIQ